LVAGGVLIAAIGQSPLEVYGLLVRQALGTGYGIGQTLFKTTPLLFAGLSVALAFRAGLFNVGAEGQMYLGGFAAALVGAYAPLPGALKLPAALLAAALAGGAWGTIPGVLKARFGAHEVINTIMLNFIAFALVSWWGRRSFLPATVRTADIAPEAWVPRLEVIAPWLRGSPANLTLLLGLVLAVALGVLAVPHPRRLRDARARPQSRRGRVRRRAARVTPRRWRSRSPARSRASAARASCSATSTGSSSTSPRARASWASRSRSSAAAIRSASCSRRCSSERSRTADSS
jgi:hypothetical protein